MADYMLGPATERCDDFCMELAPRCEIPTRKLPRSSWVLSPTASSPP